MHGAACDLQNLGTTQNHSSFLNLYSKIFKRLATVVVSLGGRSAQNEAWFCCTAGGGTTGLARLSAMAFSQGFPSRSYTGFWVINLVQSKTRTLRL